MTTTVHPPTQGRATTGIKPRHQRQRPGLSAKVAPIVTSRKGLVLTGTALAVPATAGAVMATTPAEASVHVASAASVPSVVHVASTVDDNVVWLRFGSSGSLVTILQQRLGTVAVDGSFGPKTLVAVKAFQSAKGIYVDGQVGPATWRALGGFPGTGASAGPGGSRCTVRVLRYGAEGDTVKGLQQRLGGVAVDGDFGVNTLAAVKSYQAGKGLAVDGVVGPNTWSSLGGFPCGTTSTGGGTTTPTPPPPTTGGGGDSSSGTLQQQAIAIAKKYLGVPYVLGGNSPSQGFDCSGLTKYVYAQLGVTLQRRARDQQATVPVTTNPIPGDLVFFGRPAHHVGIYLGNNTMLAAPYPGQVVRIQPIWDTPTSYGHVTR